MGEVRRQGTSPIPDSAASGQIELFNNLVHDARTAILMREHGVRRICTRDADFHRFPFLEVVDPLQL